MLLRVLTWALAQLHSDSHGDSLWDLGHIPVLLWVPSSHVNHASTEVTTIKGVYVPSGKPCAEAAHLTLTIILSYWLNPAPASANLENLFKMMIITILIIITNVCLLNIYSVRDDRCHSSLTSNSCSLFLNSLSLSKFLF